MVDMNVRTEKENERQYTNVINVLYTQYALYTKVYTQHWDRYLSLDGERERERERAKTGLIALVTS